jgi:hypothetical protein
MSRLGRLAKRNILPLTFGASFAPSRVQRLAGNAGVRPSRSGREENLPEATENRMITSVPKKSSSAHFLAGSAVEQKGNTLVR